MPTRDSKYPLGESNPCSRTENPSAVPAGSPRATITTCEQAPLACHRQSDCDGCEYRDGSPPSPPGLLALVLLVLSAVLSLIAIYLSLGALRRSDPVMDPQEHGAPNGITGPMVVLRPAEPNGTAVFYVLSGAWHPIDWSDEYFRRWVGPLLASGYTVIGARHRQPGKIPEMLEDLTGQLRQVRHQARDLGIDPARIVVMGYSSGGHLALLLGQREPVAMVVAWSPPVDLREWAKPGSPYQVGQPALAISADQAAACSPLLQIGLDDPPTLVVHGERDSIVPIAGSRELVGRLDQLGVQADLVTIASADHVFGAAALQTAWAQTLRCLGSTPVRAESITARRSKHR